MGFLEALCFVFFFCSFFFLFALFHYLAS
jgi:hypothetical protein